MTDPPSRSRRATARRRRARAASRGCPRTAPGATVRERIREALRAGSATARDLSKLVSVPEREVAGHLEHLARSLRRRGERLQLEPASCLECGFLFRKRSRYTRPGHCPRCRSRRLTLPRFRIESPPAGRGS